MVSHPSTSEFQGCLVSEILEPFPTSVEIVYQEDKITAEVNCCWHLFREKKIPKLRYMVSGITIKLQLLS